MLKEVQKTRQITGEPHRRWFSDETFDLIVLSVGLQTSPEVVELAQSMGVGLTGGHFCETSTFAPVTTTVGWPASRRHDLPVRSSVDCLIGACALRGDHEVLKQVYTLEPTRSGKLSVWPIRLSTSTR